MAAAVGPMLSTLAATHVQAPYSTSSAPSMADSLPTLDFKFDELRATMSSFTRRFDAFIEQGRRRVLDERNQFKMRVAEMGGMSPSATFPSKHAPRDASLLIPHLHAQSRSQL